MAKYNFAPHFSEEEFTCRCGCGTHNIDEAFLRHLERARVIANRPFRVVSGCRCKEHNKDEGGVDSSAHIASNEPGKEKKCKACDIGARGPKERFIIRKALLDAGFTRIGTGDSFLHVDEDPSKNQMRDWLY